MLNGYPKQQVQIALKSEPLKNKILIDTMLLFLEDGRVQAESVKYHGSSLIWINGWTKC